eukprot:13652649-Ditylum_brightwellii.AAC.1
MTTFFSKPDKFLLDSSNNKSIQKGQYLYYDENNMKWISSGKVTMKGFPVRHKEHKKKAKANKQTSAPKFYSRYPSSKSICSKSTTQKGLFENQHMYVACGFNLSLCVSDLLSKDISEGGLMIYGKREK